MIREEKTLESSEIYKGKLLHLFRDKVLAKGTVETYREVVRHRGAVAIVPVTPENKLVLVRQYRYAVESFMLEIPAGKLEGQEDPLEAAARELREETGYSADSIDLMFLLHPAVGYSSERIYIYLAQGLHPGEMDLDPSEDIELMEVTFEEAKEMVRNGAITDGKTIAAVFAAADRLSGGMGQ